MSVSGLAGSLSGYCIHLPARSSRALDGRIHGFPQIRISGRFLQLGGNCLAQPKNRLCRPQTHLIRCAMDASFGDAMNNQSGNAMNNQSDVFPRINIKDPYKRLGISPEASEEEIQAARNFLIQRYAGHKPSADAIEAAHDKIIMQKFYERKRPKLQIKKKVRDVTQSRYVQAVMNRFRTPSDSKFIVITSVAFLLLGALTVLFPTEEGPTLQVAISLVTTIYFIHSRLKSNIRSFLYGAGAFILSWLLGTFLMVSVIPPILKGPTSLEVTTSLITYVLLWVASTYLK
ncbi:protein CHAPERONE-LIKE PROTEIN OF POR1, chloroplastic isoform X1 [Beta vulgaris subsp. vulgaris]|uniref:protein CHAPERONE-LIKE PROTEIN OF POR1, chloroplastic isoform X1 n=1 Tax=Beta vulgaris subsp. vulgaris TaxID=3555 RepID=UPI00053F9018|nr:protein CHAPERONE-LIKE PROTEIN OF POR1, chloroplastic isoform X1 [Beta vulgaris subsp. vulgaris]XP_019105626.1 protein CHAPERONE-LIKE PROTEIN OF POR1, chloroplastic isoform X1 [Beta vulgaris subsp. vulgaris]XP_048493741.1 protein CHAPERONE-LIKE PROTEIN OF POR1, chloroplastic isoform X1 [Beta vulgaris subsp. vulgaris]